MKTFLTFIMVVAYISIVFWFFVARCISWLMGRGFWWETKQRCHQT